MKKIDNISKQYENTKFFDIGKYMDKDKPTLLQFWFIILLFFLRKISPELTTANPPLLLRKTGPELTSMPIFLYFICGTPATAWLFAKRCHVCTWDLNRPTPGRRSRACELNHCATRPAPEDSF